MTSEPGRRVDRGARAATAGPWTSRRLVARPGAKGTQARGPSRRQARRPPLDRRLVAAAAAAGVLAGILLVALSLASAHRGTAGAAPAPHVSGAGEVAALLAGIPQNGNELGSPTAPIRLVEYTDLQCPYCAQFSTRVLPTLVRDYVRAGDVQIVFRGLAFLGPDSVTALKTVTAAAQERRLWNVAELLFVNQGAENAWVSDDLLRAVVGAAGAHPARVFADREGLAARTTIGRWARDATADRVSGTPTFFVGPRNGRLERLSLASLSIDEFRSAIDSALGR